MQKIYKGLYAVNGEEYVIDNSFAYPLRTDTTAFLLVLKGELNIQIDFTSYTVKSNEMIVIPTRCIYRTSGVSEATQLMGIVFTDDFGRKNIQNINDINTVNFFFIKKTPFIQLKQQNYKTFQLLLEELVKLKDSETIFKKEKIFFYFNLIVLEIMDFYRSGEKLEMESKTVRKKEIVEQLLQLLNIHSSQERNVEFYAEKLSVTSGYLTKVVKEVSGMTTHEIIEESVMIEARNLLIKTNLSIAEIANQLNFSDQSFFGKFFKKKMKMSPKNFRSENK